MLVSVKMDHTSIDRVVRYWDRYEGDITTDLLNMYRDV